MQTISGLFFKLADTNGFSHRERERIKKLAAGKPTSIKLRGTKVDLIDSRSFLECYDEILLREIYRFHAQRKQPVILDCGANIGLSVLYFKHLYPEARITAFEADPEIFEVLERNLNAFGFADVEAMPYAIWTDETTLRFRPNGRAGGRIAEHLQDDTAEDIEVRTVRLRDHLDQRVDMLKIDIEGAECDVLFDCEDQLHNVDHLFVEYHGRPDERQRLPDLLMLLEKTGFRYHISHARAEEQPFMGIQLKRWYDLQLNIFALRVA